VIYQSEASLKNLNPDKIRIYFPGRIRLVKKNSTLMSHLLFRSLVALGCFGILGLLQASAAPTPDQSDKPDFSGTWTLDSKASASLEPLIKKIGGNLIEQKFDAWANLKATIQQNEQVITVATRAPGFALDETLYLDGLRHPSNLPLLGATSLTARTAWSKDQKQLVVTYQIKTKQGKEGQLIVKRYLINEGKTEVVIFTLALNSEPDQISARQIWPKQA
jgi:hypothetical protein